MNTGETIALIKALGKGGGGSSLPSVTSSDNGKVLTVEDGAWAAETNALIVTFATSTASHSATEIKDAVDAGRTVIGFDSSGALYVLTQSTSSIAGFTSITAGGSNIFKKSINTNKAVASYSAAVVPVTTATDNGSELIVKNGAWTKQKKKFIVTLTPTALDYSGTMDKTVAEINAAYEAGQEIWFKLGMSGIGYLMEMAGIGNSDPESTYPSFNAKFLTNNTLLYVISGYTNNGTKQTYSTTVYPLTPAS